MRRSTLIASAYAFLAFLIVIARPASAQTTGIFANQACRLRQGNACRCNSDRLWGPLGNSGYGIVINGLAPGTYDVAIFAYSTVVNTFTSAAVVRITVR